MLCHVLRYANIESPHHLKIYLKHFTNYLDISKQTYIFALYSLLTQNRKTMKTQEQIERDMMYLEGYVGCLYNQGMWDGSAEIFTDIANRYVHFFDRTSDLFNIKHGDTSCVGYVPNYMMRWEKKNEERLSKEFEDFFGFSSMRIPSLYREFLKGKMLKEFSFDCQKNYDIEELLIAYLSSIISTIFELASSHKKTKYYVSDEKIYEYVSEEVYALDGDFSIESIASLPIWNGLHDLIIQARDSEDAYNELLQRAVPLA